jgi:hypothetical protein
MKPLFAVGLGLATVLVVLAGLVLRDAGSPPAKPAQAASNGAVLFAPRGVRLSPDLRTALAGMPAIDDASSLEAALTPDVAAIIIDGSALGLLPEGFLLNQLRAGRVLVALNRTPDDLAQAASYAEALSGDLPAKGAEALVSDSASEGPYYSYLYRSRDDSSGLVTGSGQRPFSAGLFQADLEAFRNAGLMQ